MHKFNIVALAKKEWPIFFIFGLVFLLFFIAYPIADNFAYELAMKSADIKSSLVQQSIQDESNQALGAAKNIVAEGNISSLIKNNDTAYLPVLLDQEAARRNLTFLAAVNKDGINLASIPISSNHGDYVFQTTAWGRAAARGAEMATIGEGNIFPLMVVGSDPIKESGEVQGAVFAGYLVNDDYATAFKNKYLHDGFQVLFYSKDEGILGDSFSNILTRNYLSSYFNVGSDWIQKGAHDKILQIDGENYFVGNYFFPNPENIDGGPGGVLILLPFSPVNWDILTSSGLFILFVIITCLIHFHFHQRDHHRQILAIITFLGLLIFAGTLYYSHWNNARQVAVVKKAPGTIYNSIIKFEPDNDVIDLTTEQHIAVKVATGGEAINVVKAVINFDPAKVLVTDIVTTNSFCLPGLFAEKKIDNQMGVVTITCGLPTPGFTGEEGTVAELLVQPLATGEFNLNFATDTQVIANDGLGTNVLRQSYSAQFRVADLLTSVAPTSTAPSVAPFSSTQPNSRRWYNSRAINMSWQNYSGYQYYYLLDQNPDSVPAGEFATKANEVNLSVKGDGIYYFHILAVKDGAVGPVSHYKIMIDSTPPPPPLILASATNVEVGDVVRLNFAGMDGLSGLQKGFYVKIDNSVLFPSLPELDIPFLEPGRHYLTLRVFDNAGNFSDATLEIDVGINPINR